MILVTGGAGYIGSHVCKQLLKQGFGVLVVDNLSTGHHELLRCNTFVKTDLKNIEQLRKIFKNFKIDAVIHLAGKSIVGESNKQLGKYFTENVANTINLLEAMAEAGIDKIIYSSSAAVYGIPPTIPIDETLPKASTNFYGKTKLMVEDLLEWYRKYRGIKYIALRYFNAAGASPNDNIGEWHEPETHLIPRTIKRILQGKEVEIFGNDYNTKDGTCIRDYVHVEDIADAHVKALSALDNGQHGCMNLGYCQGYTVLEIVNEIGKVLGKKPRISFKNRREGDPDALIASNELAKVSLGWQPKYNDLRFIIQTAVNWELKLQKMQKV